MKVEKFVPVGSIVKIKNNDKKLMIIGYYTSENKDEKKVYDYCGCGYPEGMVNFDKVIMFDHDAIDKIYNIGYLDDQGLQFLEKIKNI